MESISNSDNQKTKRFASEPPSPLSVTLRFVPLLSMAAWLRDAGKGKADPGVGAGLLL